MGSGGRIEDLPAKRREKTRKKRKTIARKFVPGAAFLILLGFLSAAVFAQTEKTSPEISRANDLLEQKNWREAERIFTDLAGKEPENAAVWFGLGRARHAQGRWAEAVEAFRKNVELDKSAAAMYSAAAGLPRLGKRDEAFEWLEKALENGAAFSRNFERDEDFENIRTDRRFAEMRRLVERRRFPCRDSAKAGQFDFWLGEWEVFVQGEKAGENKITKEIAGCALLEDWSGANGNRGKSLNSTIRPRKNGSSSTSEAAAPFSNLRAN